MFCCLFKKCEPLVAPNKHPIQTLVIVKLVADHKSNLQQQKIYQRYLFLRRGKGFNTKKVIIYLSLS